MGGEEGERLARLRGVGQRRLGVLAGRAGRPPRGGSRPSRVPLGPAPHRAIQASQRSCAASQARAVGEIARVERQRRRQALQRGARRSARCARLFRRPAGSSRLTSDEASALSPCAWAIAARRLAAVGW